MPDLETYRATLLDYFEEEIGGEAYFHGLAEHFDEPGASEKLALLGEVERCAAEAVRPLLQRHGLNPRDESALAAEGKTYVARHAGLAWSAFVAHMVERYPAYIDDFLGLEAMAPPEDLAMLRVLTEHEVVTIDFARLEESGAADSTRPLRDYIAACRA
jgi:dimethylamine/trimethylamine dehydrogenase